MTLRELELDQAARITHMSVDECYKERLRAVGICTDNTVTKTRDCGGEHPILVKTNRHNVFAISTKLADHIFIQTISEDDNEHSH